MASFIFGVSAPQQHHSNRSPLQGFWVISHSKVRSDAHLRKGCIKCPFDHPWRTLLEDWDTHGLAPLSENAHWGHKGASEWRSECSIRRRDWQARQITHVNTCVYVSICFIWRRTRKYHVT